MVRPARPGSRPFLAGTPQEDAALTLVVSSKGLHGVDGWLSGLRPSNWTQTASMVSNHAGIEVGNLDRNVIGKLGTDEGEATAQALRSKWQALKDRADSALSKPPSWLSTAVDKIAVFTADFKGGAQEAWQDYSNTALEYSGPVLEEYYKTVNRLIDLKNDLAKAQASGKFTQSQLLEQDGKIRQAQASVDRVRTVFSTMSGGASIDDLAQKNFGQYKSLGLAWWIGVAVVAVAIAALVYSASNLVKNVNGLVGGVGDDGEGSSAKGISTGVIGLALLLILPFLMKD
jgi:hypothetical protein